MRRMRARRNDFSPISRLPPEILSRIFDFHAINKPPLGRDHTYYRSGIIRHDRDHNPYRDLPWGPPSSLTPVQLALGWVTVMHVSRHWRKVALSNTDLWENIVFNLGAECSLSRKRPLASLLHVFPKWSETDTEDDESLDSDDIVPARNRVDQVDFYRMWLKYQ
ncbi:hypothetical protein BC827DRAFT_1223128 [Russula dissimulans]|nr:hypothetical protein BC827DRAFT_1223128 [Russula dissimulans]